jgi:glutamine synthetase
MAEIVNPGLTKDTKSPTNQTQTFEFRVPDGSANIHLIMAGLLIAAVHGLNMDNALEQAESLYVKGNIFHTSDFKNLNQLPASCYESAERLDEKRDVFIGSGVFPRMIITHTIDKLKNFNDINIRNEISEDKDRERELVIRYIHCQ